MLKKFCLILASVALTNTAFAGLILIDNFNSGAIYLNGPNPGATVGVPNGGCIFQSIEQVNSACGSIATGHTTLVNGSWVSGTGTGPGGNAAVTTAFDAISGNDVIGQSRFTGITTTGFNGNPGAAKVSINGNTAGAFDFSTDSNTTANAYLKWDGGLNNTTAIGLGLNLDLLAAGTSSFYLKYKTDNGEHVVIRPLAFCKEKDIEAYSKEKAFL